MKFDDLKKLHQKKYREQFGHYLIEGEHLVLELIKASISQAALRQSTIFITEDHPPIDTTLTVKVVSSKQMAELTETESPQGIVAVVPMLPATLADTKQPEKVICLFEI